ncbi:MAG: HYR domain-containing protein, partial [Anaerolineae bacterium]|nr:HYR domain-containing protein [Anaerolineae bacterium]
MERNGRQQVLPHLQAASPLREIVRPQRRRDDMRRKPNRIRNLALVALALMLVLPWGAAADNIVGEVVAEGGDTFEAGSSTTYRYKIVGTGGDGQPGCNCSDGTAVTVTIVTPANVTANPSSLTFTQCNVFQLVAFTASAAGNYDIAATWSDAGPGQYSTQPAEFTLHVLPGGADTTPPVVTCPEDITAEATGPEGAVVTFEATATDDVGVASIVATPPSGSTFPLGTTTVVV